MVFAISYEVVHFVTVACWLSTLAVTHVTHRVPVTVLLHRVSWAKGVPMQTACLLCGLQLDEGRALFTRHASA